MNRDLDGRSAKQVDSWMAREIEGLSSKEAIQVYSLAILAIQKRALVTLSDVTLNAVLDRIQRAGEHKFSLLADMKIENSGISFEGLLARAADCDIVQVKAAFRFFLIELLTILENLTAGILMKPLYNELFQINAKAELMRVPDREKK